MYLQQFQKINSLKFLNTENIKNLLKREAGYITWCNDQHQFFEACFDILADEPEELYNYYIFKLSVIENYNKLDSLAAFLMIEKDKFDEILNDNIDFDNTEVNVEKYENDMLVCIIV